MSLKDLIDQIDADKAVKRARADSQLSGPAMAPVATDAPAEVRDAYLERALEGILGDVRTAPQGTRNDQLNRAAFRLHDFVRDGMLTPERAHDELARAGLAAGLTPTEVSATIRSAARGSAARSTGTGVPVGGFRATTVGGVQVEEVTLAELQQQTQSLWDARPILQHIRDSAYARMCAPTAVLGVCLLRALAIVPPAVVLPAIIGGPGSLNLFVALVGPSGTGKGAAEATAREAVLLPGTFQTATIGSGEGIAHQYAHREKGGGIVRDHDSVLFSVPEVDTLGAIGARQGSTLLSQLRSAFSGETLGFAYADVSRRIPIETHSYRLGMSVGVQPERAATLLDDADGGTPQRFIWLRATDPQVSAQTVAPPKPWSIPTFIWSSIPADPHAGGYRVVSVPPEAVAEVREAAAARHRGETAALDGHAMFARLKVSMALAVLDSRLAITLDDWQLAGRIMHLSDATRAHVEATLRQGQQQRRRAAAIATAEIDAEVRELGDQHTIKRVAGNILRALSSAESGQETRRLLGKRLASRDRQMYAEALDHLVTQGQIEVCSDGAKTVVRAVVK